ncbi:multidrug effflux MFS transporter [Paenibacillus taichungensis]|uniref:Bcr/CflA family efflux transporter n=1 Tax=Paenibacillus taichungensis TaxID=484184 RepID=A0ABX2MSF5_9BACL|nr:multidrug effflux MFS transporter [Paenibacillus taichungensis]NUU56965.1 multidrug effflux MFS transporter [Paenibacillus taichungensis]
MLTTSTSLQPKSKSKRLLIAIILGLLAGIGPLSIDMYLPALPTISMNLEASASIAQLSLTATLIGIALGQLILGPISDWKGRRAPLLIGISIYAVISFLCVIAPNISLFIVLRFIQGVAGSAGIVIAFASVRDLYSGTELTKFLALLMLINGTAPIIAPIAGAEIVTLTSWRGIFVLLGILGVILFTAVFFGLKETLPFERRSEGGLRHTLITYRGLFGNPNFMGYALTQGFIMAAMFAYISGSSFVLQELYGMTPRGFSLVFALNGIGIIVTTQVAGRLAGKIAPRKLLIVGLMIAMIGALLLIASVTFLASLPVVLAGFFLIVSNVGLVMSTSTSLALQDQGRAAGSASALLLSLSFVLGGIAAPLTGLGGKETAAPISIVITGLVVAAITSYMLLIRKTSTAMQTKSFENE